VSNEGDAIRDLEVLVQRGYQGRARQDRILTLAYPIGLSVAVILLWEVGVRALHVPTYLVPAPSEIAASIGLRWSLLIHHGIVTTLEVVLGFGLSIITGIPLAIAIFAFPIVARSVYPLLVGSQTIPKSAIAPLFIIWFGFGLASKVLIAYLISFFPIVISTIVGLASIEQEKVWLARSMGLSPLDTFRKVRLPYALPSIFGGLKVAATLAVIGAVVGEFVGSSSGLGFLLLQANGSLDTPLLFAGLVALSVLGMVSFMVVGLAEHFSIPWHSSQRRSSGGTE
jgi:NitT/TauT family transport system permease protein